MLKVLDESTVVDESGRYRFLSEEYFCDLTKVGGRCFVCLTAPGEKTQEHVIPDWVIRLTHLQYQTIGLPNGERLPYPRYTIPCCYDCNQALDAQYEDPISRAMKAGLHGLRELHLSDPTLLIRWLNLIFFKTHYKDLFLRKNLDRRIGDEKIGDAYDWGVMNLPHSLFRAPMNDIRLESHNLGSLFAVKVLNPNWAGLWDYRDNILTGTIYVRINDVVLIAVLNDGGVTSGLMQNRFSRESGANVIQTLEMLTDIQYLNHGLTSTAEYIKRWVIESDYTGIRVELPESIELELVNPRQRHSRLWSYLERYENLPIDGGLALRNFKNQILAGMVSQGLKPRPTVMPTSSDILEFLRSEPDLAVFYGL